MWTSDKGGGKVSIYVVVPIILIVQGHGGRGNSTTTHTHFIDNPDVNCQGMLIFDGPKTQSYK